MIFRQGWDNKKLQFIIKSTMASEDVALSCLVMYKLIPWALLGAFVLVLVRYGRRIRAYLFSVIYTRFFLPTLMVKMEPFKKQLFADLEDFESKDRQLKNEGLIRILEIGCGAGGNFPFYPKNCRIVCYDPNPHFQKHLFAHHEEFPHVCLEQFVVAPGEDLSLTDDGTVDVVVSTLVNCSVTDLDRVLNEVQRVLAPGGRYYFLDHVVQPKGSKRYLVGKMLKPLFAFVFECDLQRDIASYIRQAGFSSVSLTEFDPKQGFPIGHLVKDFIMGCAIK